MIPISQPHSTPVRKSTEAKKILGVFLVIACILGVCGLPFLLAFAKFRALSHSQRVETQLPVIAQIPTFQLINHKKEPVTSETFRGKTWIADFIFTRCGSSCPAMTQKMKILQSRVSNLKLTSFTVDPSYDTPEILGRYIQRFELNDQNWMFLTGTKEELIKTAKGFKVTGANEPVFHSDRFVLVDSHGLIRGYYDPQDKEGFEKLIADAKSLFANTEGNRS
ncbi:MAG: SCO family protein [Candidatus Omnitrophica bacterium]|nr:SCO family protein [Candidatus Omnitrophota bacterium]